jgi:hypothetical protein
MSSMCVRNGQESCYTQAPLLFIALQPILAAMGTFCAHADGPRPLVKPRPVLDRRYLLLATL